MPKRTKRNSRHLKKGGDIIGVTPSQPIDQPSSFETWLNKAKKAASSAISSASSAASSAANSATSAFNSTPPPPTGGKRRRKGGSSKQFSLTDLASTASPIRGILSAMPQVWVGGKTRKRSCNKRHKHTKSCKSKTYKKRGNRKKRTKTMKFPFSNSLNRLIKM
jgi:hypothetical protein